ncbi:MAG: hypothetical protein OEL83_18805 [Desulforhopalus sp.]|nr:hypothetical protein [Desulforhopalus sp.]
MATAVTKNPALQLSKTFACCLLLTATLGLFSQIAVGAPPNGLGGIREANQPETADPAPGSMSVARIQSAAKKDVDEAVLQEKSSVTTSPPQPMPKSGGRVKRVKALSDPSSEKNDMRAIRGAGAGIQEEDSLSGGSSTKSAPTKAKAGAKEDSF